MIEKVTVKNFKAVSYLEPSLLVQNHPKGIKLSTTKPNVIVGPNGAGKSALLKSLALYHLAWFLGSSSLDNNYVLPFEADKLWSKEPGWQAEYEFMAGLKLKGASGPALYYRSGHLPGADNDVTAAMMSGYFKEARAFDDMTREKSSGQQTAALLAQAFEVLQGREALKVTRSNWSLQHAKREVCNPRAGVFPSKHDALAVKLMEHAATLAEPTSLVLLDEPESSLDTLTELQMWRTLESMDATKAQAVVATHSLYPLLKPDRFNIIEAVPGYQGAVTTAFSAS